MASLLATTDDTINKATVSYKGETSYVYNGKAQGMEVESITPFGTDMTPVTDVKVTGYSETDRAEGYYYFYVDLDGTGNTAPTGVTYKNDKGKDVAVVGDILEGKPTEVGNYAVVAGYTDASGNWTFVNTAAAFTITAQSLDGATVYVVNDDDEKDVSNTTFAYTGEADCDKVQNVIDSMGVAVDGVALDEDDFTVSIYATGTSTALADTSYLVPGTTYTALVAGANGYHGQSEQVTFTYQKLDLSKATVKDIILQASPSESTVIAEAVINGVGYAGNFGGGSRIQASFVSGPNGNLTDKAGTYTYEISATEDGEAFITGTAKVTVTFANQIADVSFDGCTGTTSTGTSQNVDLSAEEPNYFDATKIKVTYGTDTEIDADDYEVTYWEGDKEVSADDLKQPVTYTVKVSVNFTDENDQLVVGSGECEVKVSYTGIQDANVYVSFGGENVPSTGFDTPYTGEDLLGGIAVKGDRTFVEGTDYEVTVEKQSDDGKLAEVDEIVNAGMYKVTVKGISWDEDLTFEYEVTPLELASARVNYDVVTDPETNEGFLAYTGEVIEATYTFVDSEGNDVVLPVDAYEVSYRYDYKDAELKDVCKDGKTYTAVIELKGDYAENYELAKSEVYGIEVSDKKFFVDVDNTAYYAQAVYTAVEQGYVQGMGGSNLFAPNASISRADMTVILYRMAGGELDNGVSEDMTTEEKGYLSKFDDVDTHAYYAKALAWATRAGIVSGYEDGTFGPADDVTVEQFVTMLARYADAVGDYEAVEDVDAALSEVADGSQVSDFAQEAMAWAVENDFVGQGGADLQPKSSVSRGRAVTIDVRYQPAQLDVVEIVVADKN